MNKFLCAIILLFLISCKTTSVAVKTQPAVLPKLNTSTAIIDSIQAHAFHFEWFSGKARVGVTRGNDNTNFTANFRIKKDSAIWISITPALGVEVARMLLTKDSIQVINRLSRKRDTRGYDFFKSYTSLPVDFYTVQNLITGNLLFIRNSYDVKKTTDSLILLLSNENSAGDSIVLSKSFQLLSQFLTESPQKNFSSSNSLYDIQYNPPFSLWRKIVIRRPEETVIDITFNKIKLNDPLKFPFKGDE